MLRERSHEQEIMDDLSISGSVVGQTLRELNTINKLLGGNKISISAFKRLLGNRTRITLADLGCGGGDILAEMAAYTQKVGVQAKFIGIDANPYIIEYAKHNTNKFPEITYQPINIFDEKFYHQDFDIIHCCLFVHHFTSDDLVTLFRQFKKQARLGVIINDLHRHPVAYWSIYLLTSLFSKSAMVKNDASISVARGFKRKEIRSIMKEAGIGTYHLKWRWAFRWELIF